MSCSNAGGSLAYRATRTPQKGRRGRVRTPSRPCPRSSRCTCLCLRAASAESVIDRRRGNTSGSGKRSLKGVNTGSREGPQRPRGLALDRATIGRRTRPSTLARLPTISRNVSGAMRLRRGRGLHSRVGLCRFEISVNPSEPRLKQVRPKPLIAAGSRSRTRTTGAAMPRSRRLRGSMNVGREFWRKGKNWRFLSGFSTDRFVIHGRNGAKERTPPRHRIDGNSPDFIVATTE